MISRWDVSTAYLGISGRRGLTVRYGFLNATVQHHLSENRVLDVRAFDQLCCLRKGHHGTSNKAPLLDPCIVFV
jgi:hypothetical protein